MSQVFGSGYAGAYDTIYREKDYDGECALIERIFGKYATKPVRKVLDLGCGTGNHALRLAAKKYEVTGVDRSAEMLGLAEKKAKQQRVTVSLHQASIPDLNLNREFDAVLMMFAVLGYHLKNEDVLGALRAARKHVAKGGLLLFDVWYGPAVLNERPGDRLRVIESEEGTLLRTSSGELDSQQQICTVHFQLWQMKGDKVVNRTDESHPMRYFFPQELRLFLETAGFRLLRIGAFPDFEREPDETTWNVMVAAEAI